MGDSRQNDSVPSQVARSESGSGRKRALVWGAGLGTAQQPNPARMVRKVPIVQICDASPRRGSQRGGSKWSEAGKGSSLRLQMTFSVSLD